LILPLLSFLPLSLAFSSIYITLELYLIVRLASILAPPFLSFLHRLGCLRDIRIIWGLSLLLLDLLTIFPMAVFTNVLAEFIPFSIGSLAVLG
jgi:hypothetical protein